MVESDPIKEKIRLYQKRIDKRKAAILEMQQDIDATTKNMELEKLKLPK